jgi:hypothetical protein
VISAARFCGKSSFTSAVEAGPQYILGIAYHCGFIRMSNESNFHVEYIALLWNNDLDAPVNACNTSISICFVIINPNLPIGIGAYLR